MKTFQQFQEDANNKTTKYNPGNVSNISPVIQKNLDLKSKPSDFNKPNLLNRSVNLYKRVKPLKNLLRFDNVRNVFNKNMSTKDRVFSGLGVVAPYSGEAMRLVFDQGGNSSKTAKAANYIDKKVSKITGGRISSNPDTHFGKKISDFTGKKLDQILQRRNQNRGASDLKGSTSGIG